MKTAVRRRWIYTIILLAALTVVWGGLQKCVHAQILQVPIEPAASLSAAITKSSSSQPSLSLIGGNLSALIGSDPTFSLMGFNPVLNPFIASPSMASNAMLMSAAMLSQSLAAGISPGGGIGGMAYPSSAYQSAAYQAGLTGSSLPVDPSVLMNFFGMGGGIYPSAGGALNNIALLGFAGMPIVPFSPDQVTGMGSLAGLGSGLIIPPLSPFGMMTPSFSSLQMGGYPYTSQMGGYPYNPQMGGYPYNPASGMLFNGMASGVNPYAAMSPNGMASGLNPYAAMSPNGMVSGLNPYSAALGMMPFNSMMSGVNPLLGGGYYYGGYFPPAGSNSMALGSSPYPSTSTPVSYSATGTPLIRPAGSFAAAPMTSSPSNQPVVSSYGGLAAYGGTPAYGGYSTGGLPYGGVSGGILFPSSSYTIMAGIVSGTVMDQKEIGLVGVTFESRYSGWVSGSDVSDPLGHFGVTFPPTSGCSLTISYGSSHTLYPNFSVAGPTALDFVLLPGTIHDYVTGMPLSGVSIIATSLASSRLEAQSSTNSDGVFQIFLPKGNYTIMAKLPLSSVADTTLVGSPIEVPSTNNAKINGTLHLPIFAGTVVDAADENLTLDGAQIKITPTGSSTPSLPISSPVTAVNGGKFQIPLPKGTYQLDITKNGYQPRPITKVITGTTEDNRIELAKQVIPPPQNNRPVIKTPNDGEVIPVTAGSDLSFSVEAEDPENSYLYFTITGPDNWPKMVKDGGSISTPKTYRYSTTLADVGEYTMEITVGDLALSTTVHIKVKVQYPVQVKLTKGINLISYPAGPGTAVDSAFDLLSLLGDANQVDGIAIYDSTLGQGKYVQAAYGKDRKKAGADFFINGQSGYIVYAKQTTTANLNISSGSLTSCILQLKQGTNLVGISAVLSNTYSSYDLLMDFGQDSVESIYHYNAKAGGYEFTYWIGNLPGGFDFPIRMGEGYFIGAKTDKQIRLPKLR